MATVTADSEIFLDLIAAAELIVEFLTDSAYVPDAHGPRFAMGMEYHRVAAQVGLAVLTKKAELTALAKSAGYTGKENNERRYQRPAEADAPQEG